MYAHSYAYTSEVLDQLEAMERLAKNRKVSPAGGTHFFPPALVLLKRIARLKDLATAPELRPKDSVTLVDRPIPGLFDDGTTPPSYLDEGIQIWTRDFGEELVDGHAEVRQALGAPHLRTMFRTALEKKILPKTVGELLRTPETWLTALEKAGPYTHYQCEMLFLCLAHMRRTFPVQAPDYVEDPLLREPFEENASDEDDSEYVPDGASDDDASEEETDDENEDGSEAEESETDARGRRPEKPSRAAPDSESDSDSEDATNTDTDLSDNEES